jgi:uncharacterized protein
MSLEVTINDAIKQAMLAKAEADLRGLRAIKAAVLNAKTSGEFPNGLQAADEVKLLQKLVKSRKDSLDIYTAQNRPELAAKEQEEINVIEKYLPKQMEGAELKTALQAIIAEVGATSAADMGKVMGAANKALAGKAEGRAISTMVKELLG